MRKQIILFISLALWSCQDSSDTGRVYLPDMAYHRSYKTYDLNAVTGDSGLFRNPVKGTFPRSGKPHYFGKMKNDRDSSGILLINPYSDYSESQLLEGKKLYETFCINCHGSLGDARGNLVTSKKFTYMPAKLNTQAVGNLPDGNIYNVITKGFGLMGAHGGILLPDERWLVVGYVKTFNKQNIQ